MSVETTRETPPDAPALPVVLLHPEARLPARTRPGDVGLDLRSIEALTLLPGDVATARTGLAVGVPFGHVGLILGRSGLARLGISILGGVVDPGYSGEVKVVLAHFGGGVLSIAPGDRVAQIVLIPILSARPVLVDALPPSPRGDAGFGSSGMA